MKRIGLFVLAALLGLATLLATTGCLGGDEAVIRDGLTSEFNELKNPSSDTWADVSGEMPTDVINAWLGGFNYEIGEITIDGDTATAAVTLTNKQLMPAVLSASERMTTEDLSSITTEEESWAKTTEIILEELQKTQAKTTEVVIECEKMGNLWSVSAEGQAVLTTALLGEM
jgi:hypothetical protein